MAIITGTSSHDRVNATTTTAGVAGGPATIGNDTIFGLGGTDELYGDSGSDLIDGGADNDFLYGEFGDDTLLGGDGDDWLNGGQGNDRLEGGNGNDNLQDSDGINVLLGGDGNDNLSGFGTLDGGAGDDRIIFSNFTGTVTSGTAPAAVITGGAGRDTFSLANIPLNLPATLPMITDFAAGIGGDRFDLTTWLTYFATNYDGLNPFTSGHVGLRQDGADTIIRWDSTGGGNSYVDTVRLNNVAMTSLTAENFSPGYGPSTVPANPAPAVTKISIAAPAVSIMEGESFRASPFAFTVTRSGDLSVSHSVFWSVAGKGFNPATADDFVTSAESFNDIVNSNTVMPAGLINFAIGESSKTVNVYIFGDRVEERNEEFSISLSSPTNNAIIETGTVSGTIINDDLPPALISIQASANSVLEGASGSTPFTFIINRSGDLSLDHSVNWTVNGRGANPTSPDDFLDGSPLSGRVTFEIGETSRTITLNIAGDTLVEKNEDFVVSLSSATKGALVSTGIILATIVNDDSPPSIVTQYHNGTAGYDIVSLSEIGRRSGNFSREADGDVIFSRSGKTDIYHDIEVINFADGRMVFDVADPAAQVVRLYQAGLGRGVDQGGLNFWIDAVSEGTPLSKLAGSFLNSTEFASRYGGSPTDSQYIDLLYINALGRSADSGGKAYWTNLLNSGAMNRADALVSFSESSENTSRTAAVVQAGIWDISEEAAQVARLYDTALGRLPDIGGLTYWRAAIEAGSATLADLANAFVNSAEFQATYGMLSNRGFVERVYQNTLDRPGDAGGVGFWTATLDAGATRRDVLIGFSESIEHQALTAYNIMNEDPGQYGILFAG